MKRILALVGLLVAAVAGLGASYTVDSVGFLVDSNGRRVGYKRPSGAEDYFLTLNAAQTGLVKPDGTAFAAGLGTVTAGAGDLTSNAVVLGAGTVDTKVVAGIVSDGTSVFTLGTAGTVAGGIDFKNATSGTLSLRPVTGALGTVTVSLPATTGTLSTLAGTETFTNKTLTAPKVGTSLLDTNGNELFVLTATASAVNELTYANAATGGAPTFTASGGDSNIGINFVPKGTGTLQYNGTEIGFRTIPQNSKSAAYTTVLADSGKHILHPSADTTARVFTIDSNANVAYPVGTAVTIVNEDSAGALTIAITSDTLLYAATGGTGSRTCAATCVVTLIKITTTKWIIAGTGLS